MWYVVLKLQSLGCLYAKQSLSNTFPNFLSVYELFQSKRLKYAVRNKYNKTVRLSMFLISDSVFYFPADSCEKHLSVDFQFSFGKV